MLIDEISINSGLDLARLCETNWSDFLHAVKYPNTHYHYYHMKKKNGGYRTISAPDDVLMNIQSNIMRKILKGIPIHNAAYAFVEGKSIKDNALKHMNSEKVLSLDLESFYPSINRNRIYFVFLKLCGFNLKISDMLANLCCSSIGIPQGAPTSPILSNIVMYNLDKILCNYAAKNSIIYTRYADDMTFSGESKSINNNLLNKVRWMIEQQGFTIKDSKTRFSNIKNGAMITGLRVYKNKIIIPRKYIKKIETEIYYIKKFGVSDHKIHISIENRNYLKHLLGKINFVSFIENDIGDLLLNQYKEAINISDVNYDENIMDFLEFV